MTGLNVRANPPQFKTKRGFDQSAGIARQHLFRHRHGKLGARAQPYRNGAGRPYQLFGHKHTVSRDDLTAGFGMFSQFFDADTMNIPHHKIVKTHACRTVFLRKVNLLKNRP